MKRSVSSFRDLLVWQRAMQLARETYELTCKLPSTETYGLVSQTRRAAVSVASSIAEGNGRSRRQDYIRMLLLARGSAQELETQLLIVVHVGLAPHDTVARALELSREVARMLAGLVRALSQSRSDPSHP